MKITIQFVQGGREYSKSVELSGEPLVGDVVIVDNNKFVVRQRIFVDKQELNVLCDCHAVLTPKAFKSGLWEDTTETPFEAIAEPEPMPKKGKRA